MFQLFYDPLTRIIIIFCSFQIDYLRNYGYLTKTASRFGDDILHEDAATNALKALQVRLSSHVFSFMIC